MNATPHASGCQQTPNQSSSPLEWSQVHPPNDHGPSNGAQTNASDGVDLATVSLAAPVQMTSSQAKIHEESTKKALILKRKELKWKLMQASQAQNRAKLNDIQAAVNYHKLKLSKAQDLAAKLRSKYVKVVKSAKLTETQFKKADSQLSLQEKYVAEEKMQLARLAIDCIKTGTQLYGREYKLPEGYKQQSTVKSIPGLKASNQMNKQQGDTHNQQMDNAASLAAKEEILKKLSPFLRRARSTAEIKNANDSATEIKTNTTVINDKTTNKVQPGPVIKTVPIRKRTKAFVSRLSSLYDLNDSVLRNLASYRLTRKFAETGTKITDPTYSHNISPLEYICFPDLLGDCSDKSCQYQHKSNYAMTDLEKLAEILSHKSAQALFEALLTLFKTNTRSL